ncbi:hypothetical protein GCM10010912_54310 [Paenibacillus albidus]|uniref:LysM domain-containing protein n=1 Tax=Paenibacillus albidus TaxID=2041023 RepID=A0A917CYF7_9BACL|nr:LysM peptidoglycan-binding domain-containing protein [Paenibacillus albidus]GGG02644.1 hypothetical protein GCM10010912_54310 [Paenibacillus albidus]
MFDQSHGLRFDIYERIHLPAELPGIAELEEVELLPEIQVIQREDRAELYGQLLLTGLYRGEDDRTQRLEHAIPVEITVPLTRVNSLEDIGVEIENFDIDLLTMRTVNITGVLSLRGIGGVEAQPAWQQEEYTVAYSPAEDKRAPEASEEIHEPENDVLYENSLWTFGEGAAEGSEEEREVAEALSEAADQSQVLAHAVTGGSGQDPESGQRKDKELKVRTHSLESPADKGKSELTDYWQKAEEWNQQQTAVKDTAARESFQPAERVAVPEQAAPSAPPAPVVRQEEPVAAMSSEPPADSFIQEENPPLDNGTYAGETNDLQEPVDASASEEKPDLKIGVGSKKEAEAKEKEPLTFSSLLSSSRAHKEQEILNAEEEAPLLAETVPEAGNDTEWKSRFIGARDGANLFRKVRLCIVQREETLDTIAEKYQLSARELVMYNRLSGQNVEEGQVLYIP